ncbi:hypothetical protein Aperf_G00000096176 [Anoplocephala perfoliata]
MGNTEANHTSSLGIIEAPISKGQEKEGVEKGPKEIRAAGLDDLLKEFRKVIECGKISQPEERETDMVLDCKNQRAFIKYTHELKELVEKSVAENNITLILGGDHSIGTGAIEGHFKVFPDSFVVWIDAHADINTPATSITKKTHGMPLSFVVRDTYKQVPHTMGFEKLQPVMDPNQLIYIGLRDVDPGEVIILKEFGIRYFDMTDVRKLGIEKVVETTLRIIEKTKPHCSIHLSFDIDGLDPKYSPSTGTPVPGGLELEEGKYICKSLAQTGQLRSMLLSEVNTSLGSAEDAKTTLHSANELLKSALLLD